MLFTSTHSRPRYSHLIGSSDALALAQYAAQKSPLVVIAANALEAQRLFEEIPYFAARAGEADAVQGARSTANETYQMGRRGAGTAQRCYRIAQ